MLISGIILGLFIALFFLAFQNNPPFDVIDSNEFVKIVVLFLCLFPLFLKSGRDLDNQTELQNVFSWVNIFFEQAWRDFKIPKLNNLEKFSVAFMVLLFLIIGILAIFLGQYFMDFHYKIVRDSYILAEFKLPSSERQVLEAVRTYVGTLLAICVAVEAFIINQMLSVLSKAKSRENFQKIDQKLEKIISKLENPQTK